MKNAMAYSHGTIPDITNNMATDELVMTIIVAVVALETRGWISMTNMRGPNTIPPPIPIKPATIPDKKVKKA